MKTQGEIHQIITQELSKIDWSIKPEKLYHPIDYILSMGGKHLRPSLTLMACNIFSEDITPAIKPAIGIEIFHNFTLLHDDIMDKADTRRGKPTVHKKWDENVAILSGDAMLIKAYQYITTCPENKLREILQVFSQTAIEVCEGQQYDMDFETQNLVTEEMYLNMIRLKTAVLLGASLKIGAIIGGANQHEANCLYDFGINIGIAFQLKDDLLDVYGNPKDFGKTIGGDITCNKKTFLMIRAINKANGQEKEELEKWLNINSPEKNSEKIKVITKLYSDLKVDIDCKKIMTEYKQKAISNLKEMEISGRKTTLLQSVAEFLMDRNK